MDRRYFWSENYLAKIHNSQVSNFDGNWNDEYLYRHYSCVRTGRSVPTIWNRLVPEYRTEDQPCHRLFFGEEIVKIDSDVPIHKSSIPTVYFLYDASSQPSRCFTNQTATETEAKHVTLSHVEADSFQFQQMDMQNVSDRVKGSYQSHISFVGKNAEIHANYASASVFS